MEWRDRERWYDFGPGRCAASTFSQERALSGFDDASVVDGVGKKRTKGFGKRRT
jgi:hypothetical protein